MLIWSELKPVLSHAVPAPHQLTPLATLLCSSIEWRRLYPRIARQAGVPVVAVDLVCERLLGQMYGGRSICLGKLLAERCSGRRRVGGQCLVADAGVWQRLLGQM